LLIGEVSEDSSSRISQTREGKVNVSEVWVIKSFEKTKNIMGGQVRDARGIPSKFNVKAYTIGLYPLIEELPVRITSTIVTQENPQPTSTFQARPF